MESKEDYDCAICMQMMVEPVKLNWNHHFCKFWLNSYLENQEETKCPLCRDELGGKESVRKLKVDSKLESQAKDTFPDEYKDALEMMNQLKLDQDKLTKVVIKYGNEHWMVRKPAKSNSK